MAFFQTTENQMKKNYLYNLFNIQSNIKKYKSKLNDNKVNNLKLNDKIKMDLLNNIDTIFFI